MPFEKMAPKLVSKINQKKCGEFLVLSCFVILTSLVLAAESCHKKCTPKRGKGNPGPYSKLYTAQFPRFQYLQSVNNEAAGAAALEEELRSAEIFNIVVNGVKSVGGFVVGGLSTIAGLTMIPGAPLVVGTAGNFVLDQLLKMKDVVGIVFRQTESKLKGTIADSVGTKAVNEMGAKLEKLQISVSRLNSNSLNETLKRQEIVPARQDCIEILHLFQNKEYVFWKEGLYSAPYFLRFVLIWVSVVLESVRLEPTHRQIYERERQKMIMTLQEYRYQVLAKRPGAVSIGKEKARKSVCDTLYYSVKCDGELKSRKRPVTNLAQTTSCAQGMFNEAVYKFYMKWDLKCDSVINCIIDSHGSFKDSSVHPRLGTDDAPAINDDYIYDSVSNSYFCGENSDAVGMCLWEYQQFLRDRINHDFDLHLEILRGIRI